MEVIVVDTVEINCKAAHLGAKKREKKKSK
jgi:hypothetical protein